MSGAVPLWAWPMALAAVVVVATIIVGLALVIPSQPTLTAINDAQTGNDICDCGLLPLFGIIIPLVFVLGLVGLAIAAVRFKRDSTASEAHPGAVAVDVGPNAFATAPAAMAGADAGDSRHGTGEGAASKKGDLRGAGK